METYIYKAKNGDEYELVNDLKTGEWKKYDTKGQIIEIGSYSNDQKDGEWKVFDSEGQVKWTFTYKDGILID